MKVVGGFNTGRGECQTGLVGLVTHVGDVIVELVGFFAVRAEKDRVDVFDGPVAASELKRLGVGKND